MAKLKLRRNNPYSIGSIVNFDDNTRSLQRPRLNYIASERDRYHTVTNLDSWDTIAFDYYGESKFWWILTDINDIQNPFDISTIVGQSIIIPNLEQLKATVL